ncbi:hypothetical protein [Acinetobacter bereziniae]|uniref:hypothetical protein n=1 Tax=Acinetobacter bereziniae TaxID=106648 RepID=UPI000EF69838|nr:hypothetical protein [Acinetobacter bereziniae]
MCFDDENIIEDGDEGLPEEAQKFKSWYEVDMAWSHTEVINGEQAILMPAFDYNTESDEFLDVDLDKFYMTWKGARSADQA